MSRFISTLLLCIFTMGACASTLPNVSQQPNMAQKLLPSVVLIEARHEFVDKNEKGEIEVRLMRTRGSGTIVHRITNKSGGYTYYVLSCGHLYEPRPGWKISVILRTFDHEGWNTVRKFPAESFWSYENNGYDTSLVKFKSKKFFPIVPLAKKIPRNLMGKECILMGCPFGNVPMIAYGHFGVNCPVTSLGSNYVEMTVFVAPGNSGSGAYLYNEDARQWELVGVITHGYGGGGAGFTMAAIALRLDAIRVLLKRFHLSHMIGE